MSGEHIVAVSQLSFLFPIISALFSFSDIPFHLNRISLLLGRRREVHNFHLEDQSRVRRDRISSTLATIRKVRWASQNCLLAFLELANALVPGRDDLAHPHLELNRLTSFYARVKDRTVCQFARVVHLNSAASWHDISAAAFV